METTAAVLSGDNFKDAESVLADRVDFVLSTMESQVYAKVIKDNLVSIEDGNVDKSSNTDFIGQVDNRARLLEIPKIDAVAGKPRAVLVRLQEWEGVVSGISKDYFTARLVDITANETVANEEADFLIDDLSETDKGLLKEGAVFRWVIGYKNYSTGSKQRVSQIVFRRLPQWTKRDFEEAEKRAALYKNITWE